ACDHRAQTLFCFSQRLARLLLLRNIAEHGQHSRLSFGRKRQASDFNVKLRMIESETLLFRQLSGLLKLIDVVNALTYVVVIVRMDHIENRLADQLFSVRCAPELYGRGIDVRKVAFAMDDDGVRREFDETAITFLTFL